MLGFLHSGAVHVKTFEQLVQTAQPGIVTQHVVREDLLASAVATGGGITRQATVTTAAPPNSPVAALVAFGSRESPSSQRCEGLRTTPLDRRAAS